MKQSENNYKNPFQIFEEDENMILEDEEQFFEQLQQVAQKFCSNKKDYREFKKTFVEETVKHIKKNKKVQGASLSTSHSIEHNINLPLIDRLFTNPLNDELEDQIEAYNEGMYCNNYSQRDSVRDGTVEDRQDSGGEELIDPMRIINQHSRKRNLNYDRRKLLMGKHLLNSAKRGDYSKCTPKNFWTVLCELGDKFYWLIFINALVSNILVLTHDSKDRNTKVFKMKFVYAFVSFSLLIIAVIGRTHTDLHLEDLYNSWMFMSEYYETEEDMDTAINDTKHFKFFQSGEDNIGMFSTVFVTLINMGCGIKPKNTCLKAIEGALKFNERQKENTVSSILQATKVLNTFFTETIKVETLANFFEIDQISDERVHSFKEQVNVFISECNAGRRINAEYNERFYIESLRHAKDLMNMMDKKSYDYKTMEFLMNSLNKTREALRTQFSSMNGDRVEPVGVLITGKPGCMKSVLLKRLGYIIASLTIPKDWEEEFLTTPDNFMYVVPNGKFFDKYNYKAWIAFFDDIFQKTDVKGSEDSEALQIIKMINSAPYNLNMANVEAKNTMYFRSPFVLGTSNIRRPELLNSVNCPEAVFRRFNIEIETVINPEYLNENLELDYEKLPAEMYDFENLDIENRETSVIPNDFWKLHVKLKSNKEVKDLGILPLEDVIELIVEQHKKRIREYYINKETNKNAVGDIVNNLKERFSRKEQSAYSKLFRDTQERKTFQMYVPQSTDDNKSDIEMESVQEVKVKPGYDRFITFLGKLPEDRYLEYLNSWFSLLDSHGISYMFDKTFSGLKKHNDFMMSIGEQDLFSYQYFKMNAFFALVDNSFVTCFRKGINPVSLIPVMEEVHPNTYIQRIRRIIVIPLKKMYAFIKRYWYILILAAGGLYIIFLQLSNMFTGIIKPFMFQSVDSNRMMKRDVFRPKNEQKHTTLSSKTEVQFRTHSYKIEDMQITAMPKIKNSLLNLGRDNLNDITKSIMNKYFFVAFIVTPNNDNLMTRLGHMINMKSSVFWMPLHYIYMMEKVTQKKTGDGAYVIMMSINKNVIHKMFLTDFMMNFRTTTTAANRDSCLVNIPVANPNSVGAYRYMLKNDDIKTLRRTGGFKCSLFGTSYIDIEKDNLIIRNVQTVGHFNDEPVPIEGQWDDQLFRYPEVVEYTAEVDNGDCGSLLFVNTTKFENRCLLGMHVAGGQGTGYANIIPSELMDEMFSDSGIVYNENHFLSEEVPDFVQDIPIDERPDILVPQASIINGWAPNTVSKSEICKSKLHGKLPKPWDVVTTLPAKLHPFLNEDGNIIDPGDKALLNYGLNSPPIKEDYIILAFESYEELIFRHSRIPLEYRSVIPLDISLHAFDNIHPISSSTSPGFPLNKPDKCENIKKSYYAACEFNDEQAKDKAYEQIALVVHKTLSQYDRKERPFFAYVDCLKDEKRDRSKALEGKTRLFSASPFIFLVICRMYFGSFCSEYFAMNIKVGSALGLNPYSEDWDNIARQVLKYSKNDDDLVAGAGDHSKFDGHEFPVILNRICEMINNWYGKDNPDNIIRSMIFSEISYSKHIFKSMLYFWETGMPSGNPLTPIINTIYNNIVFRISFQEAQLPITKFNDLVFLICLGDDNLWSTHETIRDKFNEMTMPDLMKSAGMVFTNELKENAKEKYRKLTEVEFLKRGFKKDKALGRWIGPLRESAIVEMLNWTKKGLLGDTITVDNIANVSEILLYMMKKNSIFGKNI